MPRWPNLSPGGMHDTSVAQERHICYTRETHLLHMTCRPAACMTALCDSETHLLHIILARTHIHTHTHTHTHLHTYITYIHTWIGLLRLGDWLGTVVCALGGTLAASERGMDCLGALKHVFVHTCICICICVYVYIHI